MAGDIFIGNNSMIATRPNNILIGDSNNMAKTVTSIFVGDAYNQAVQVWPNKLVPEGYRRVKYIESRRDTNGFETGVKPDSNTRIVIDFMYSSITIPLDRERYDIAAPFFTPFHNSPYYEIDLRYTLGYSTFLYTRTGSFFRSCFSKNIAQVHYNIYDSDIENQLLNKRMRVDLNKSNGQMYINNSLVHTFNTQFSQLPDSIVLLSYFSQNYPSSYNPNAKDLENKIRLYNCKIYQNDELIRDYIPCYKEPRENNNVYLYDSVNGTFLQCAYPEPFYGPTLGPDA